ncbi:hypothetical protein [Alkaliphilus peptidifermentans]|uniref:Transcriptional regulator n=1 Tax=Alkaliphilus peptidifermentans DSM 18978 TaxID=1120976 RepID=A0A1G5BRJ5_9FIRM|nr:hypothetical protein [Alkaliphilus peptidifermentans]SCX92664.1 hypothetical protein SAMN03080606_00499 [Alkaliphilus peptidifermentans DSM 18978]
MKKIGIVGHTDNINRIQQVIDKSFPNIDGYPIQTNEMSHIQTTVNYLKEHINDFDGIIFTGKILFDIMNHSMHSQNPWVYIENDESQLQRILLEASLKHHMDITQISIDSYSEGTVRAIYEDSGLSSGQYSAYVSKLDIFKETFIDDLFKFHKNNYLARPDLICITGISSVYRLLQAHQVPSLLLTPNENAIKNRLYNLLEKIRLENMSISQIVVISIEIDVNNEYDLISENEYSIMLQKTRITEEVYKFTQRIQAAVIETEKNYLLFTTKQIVEFETKNLGELSILSSIKNKTNNTVSVGIGFGITAREAKVNAIIGKNKALKMGGNQCFVVYDRNRMERITPFDRSNSSISPLDLPLKDISEKSGVSINNIYQLKCIMDIYKKSTFTSLELSEEFGNSLRSMNRIIERLEQAGYIEVVGKKIVGKAGRPSRILKLLI